MEGEEGNFVCAFQRSLDALVFANELQLVLVELPWSAQLLGSPMACPHYSVGGRLVFRGLRVKVGMCSGTPSRVQVSPRTGRMEYFGPILNHAARVASAAHGGQVRPGPLSFEAAYD
jgi:adenylate cyclase